MMKRQTLTKINLSTFHLMIIPSSLLLKDHRDWIPNQQIVSLPAILLEDTHGTWTCSTGHGSNLQPQKIQMAIVPAKALCRISATLPKVSNCERVFQSPMYPNYPNDHRLHLLHSNRKCLHGVRPTIIATCLKVFFLTSVIIIQTACLIQARPLMPRYLSANLIRIS